MKLKTRRQQRYMKLRDNFFLPFESRPLSKVPTRICPYLREMLKERKADYLKARAAGKTQRQWEQEIKEEYHKNRWLTAGRVKIYYDPWKMLRDYEDRWRAKNPEYTSPWQKRWRDWSGFLVKAEKTIRKQRGVAT